MLKKRCSCCGERALRASKAVIGYRVRPIQCPRCSRFSVRSRFSVALDCLWWLLVVVASVPAVLLSWVLLLGTLAAGVAGSFALRLVMPLARPR